MSLQYRWLRATTRANCGVRKPIGGVGGEAARADLACGIGAEWCAGLRSTISREAVVRDT
ncbi:hypothetical protein [Falsiroseomonas sp. HW251]|uniref:hypothetical protein n=1 Tax=Falsiroseomonas sp. HW251 TaxID=3390998 RepID=UPI003D3114A4